MEPHAEASPSTSPVEVVPSAPELSWPPAEVKGAVQTWVHRWLHSVPQRVVSPQDPQTCCKDDFTRIRGESDTTQATSSLCRERALSREEEEEESITMQSVGPPPGLEFPPGLETVLPVKAAMPREDPISWFVVEISGLPNHLLDADSTSVWLEQVEKFAGGEPCKVETFEAKEGIATGKAHVKLSSERKATLCLEYFKGCTWVGEGNAKIIEPAEAASKGRTGLNISAPAWVPSQALAANEALAASTALRVDAPEFVPGVWALARLQNYRLFKSPVNFDNISTDPGESASED